MLASRITQVVSLQTENLAFAFKVSLPVAVPVILIATSAFLSLVLKSPPNCLSWVFASVTCFGAPSKVTFAGYSLFHLKPLPATIVSVAWPSAPRLSLLRPPSS